MTLLFVMALALGASALLLGIGADRLRRRGTPFAATLAVATGAAILAQLALALRWPVPVLLPWVTIAVTGAGTVLSYAILSEMFPKSVSGRANGALNMLHVTAAFAIQYAIGLVVQQWPAEDGHYPPEAYQAALGLNLVLQAGAFLWFVRPERETALCHLPEHPIHAFATSLGLAPSAALSYARARHAWSLRLARARSQQQAWRTAAFASFAVLALLAASLGSNVLGTSVAAHERFRAAGRAVVEHQDRHPQDRFVAPVDLSLHEARAVPATPPRRSQSRRVGRERHSGLDRDLSVPAAACAGRPSRSLSERNDYAAQARSRCARWHACRCAIVRPSDDGAKPVMMENDAPEREPPRPQAANDNNLPHRSMCAS